MNQASKNVSDAHFAISVLQLAIAKVAKPVADIVGTRAVRILDGTDRPVVTPEGIRAASVLRRLTDLQAVLGDLRSDADFWRRYLAVINCPMPAEATVVSADNVVQPESPESAA